MTCFFIIMDSSSTEPFFLIQESVKVLTPKPGQNAGGGLGVGLASPKWGVAKVV